MVFKSLSENSLFFISKKQIVPITSFSGIVIGKPEKKDISVGEPIKFNFSFKFDFIQDVLFAII